MHIDIVICTNSKDHILVDIHSNSHNRHIGMMEDQEKARRKVKFWILWSFDIIGEVVDYFSLASPQKVIGKLKLIYNGFQTNCTGKFLWGISYALNLSKSDLITCLQTTLKSNSNKDRKFLAQKQKDKQRNIMKDSSMETFFWQSCQK